MGDAMREELEKERRRGEEARQLLNNKLFKEAFDAAHESVLNQMEEVSLRDVEMHTRLIVAKKTIRSVRSYIERIVQTGELAEMQLTDPNVVKTWLKRS